MYSLLRSSLGGSVSNGRIKYYHMSHFRPVYITVAKGIVVLPKSVTASRILVNSTPAQLSAEDAAKVDGLSTDPEKAKRFIKPPWGVKVGFEDWDIASKQEKRLGG